MIEGEMQVGRDRPLTGQPSPDCAVSASAELQLSGQAGLRQMQSVHGSL